MKKFAIPAVSLAVLMASGIALAQTAQDQQSPTQPSQEMQQKPQDPATQTKTPEQPNTEGTTAQQSNPSDSGLAAKVDAGKAVLATRFIGSSVYTAGSENVGDINDLVFDEKGNIQAAIVGVGGFLGMGEKDVALPLDKITVIKDETNAIKLTVLASRQDLERAPAFDKTLFLVKAAPASSSSTTTAPASGGATTQ